MEEKKIMNQINKAFETQYSPILKGSTIRCQAQLTNTLPKTHGLLELSMKTEHSLRQKITEGSTGRLWMGCENN